MEWESNSEFHKSRAEVGRVKIGGSDEGSKNTPTNETRRFDEQHTENAEFKRNQQIIYCNINEVN
jgi:hypothetical protein